MKKRFKLPVASHLTLVSSTENDLRNYLTRAVDHGVDFIVALRGDPPQGKSEFEQTEGGYRYANELVELINREFPDFGILVAGYPEKTSRGTINGGRPGKLEAERMPGPMWWCTQLFYENADFYRFRDQCRERGITVPIVPGLLPVTNLGQIQRIASLCGSKLPQKFVARLGEKDDN